MIPYGCQNITSDDIDAVKDILNSDYLTQGPTVELFEEAVCAITGSHYAVAMNSGTSALHLACLALDLTEGDVLWTSPITFVASANCALYCRADVDFIDIDPDTFNIDISMLEAKLEIAEKTGVLPKIIVPVHLCGLSCDMEALEKLSRRFGFKIIEDACHAIGGKYKNNFIGSCKYSDITIFSFHPVKIITTGEGGMALTNNHALAEKIELLRSHGITKKLEKMTGQSDGPWYYQQKVLGYNYRMSDIQAALGLSQLTKLHSFVEERHCIAQKYYHALNNLPIKMQHQSIDCYSSYHLFVIRLDLNNINNSHLEVFNKLLNDGVGVNLHYMPVYLQPYYKSLGFKQGLCKEAEQYYNEAITIPIFPQLKEYEFDHIVNSLFRAIN